MHKFLKSELLLVSAIFILVLYLSNDFAIIDIRQTALIAAVGVDSSVDGGYEVSVQIAIPQATDQTASNSSAVLSGHGKTVGDALERIGTSTGWYTKLSFCNLIVLGEGLFEEDVMKALDFFLRTDKIQDTARLCMAERSAKEILCSKTPLDELSAFSVTKILEPHSESLSAIAASGLKEFAMGYYSASEFSSMPIVKLKKAEGQSGGGSDVASSEKFDLRAVVSDDTGDSSQENTPSEKQKSHIFDATTTVLLSGGVKKAVLTSEETLVYNIFTHPINEVSVELPNITYEGKSTTAFVSIRNAKKSLKLTFKGAVPVLELELSIDARLDDTDTITSPNGLVKRYVLSDEMIRTLNGYISEKAKAVFEKARAVECDVFQIKNRLYRTQNKYYENMKDCVLQNAELSVKIRTKSYK